MSLNVVTLLYLIASVCFIQALKGLSHPTTSIRGNVFGMVGMGIAILTTGALIVELATQMGQARAEGMVWVLVGRGSERALRANTLGLGLACAYLAWSAVAQQQVRQMALASLEAQGIAAERVLVTPAPFSTLLWRVVAVSDGHYHEGFRSLLDAPGPIAFDRFARGDALAAELQGHDGVQRIRDFSRGFYKLHESDSRAVIADLRMGQEPNYVFAFAVAERRSALRPLAESQSVGGRADIGRTLAWLWPRMWGQALPPPR